MTLTCHCGAIRLETASRPDHVNACNCTLCRKTGAHWAYFAPADVRVAGEAAAYCRADKPGPGARIHFCPDCGTTTHFDLTEAARALHGDGVVGVNMRLAEERDLAGVELRFPDGLAWPGHGPFGYVRPPRLIGRDRPEA